MGFRTSPFHLLPEKRACWAALSPLGPPGARGRHTEPRTAGWEPGQAPPPPSPRPPKRAPAPSDWGWAWGFQDPGRGNSAVCWLRLETSPRGAPSLPAGLRGRPNPPRRGSWLRCGAEVGLALEGRLWLNSGDPGSSVGGPAGSGRLGRFHSAFLRSRALAEIRCPKSLIAAK